MKQNGKLNFDEIADVIEQSEPVIRYVKSRPSDEDINRQDMEYISHSNRRFVNIHDMNSKDKVNECDSIQL